jgi:glutamate synthase domain-containing protein 2/FAD/FMN-containing dehydrogenase/ferredoxin/glutamate synthase domain-containing protein 1
MSNISSIERFNLLFESSAERKVKSQQKSVELLFENFNNNGHVEALASDSVFQKLRSLLSEATTIFALNPVQKEVYHSDSGTVAIPKGLRKALVNIKSRFVVRPGNLADLQAFVKYAIAEKIKFTVRGSGTWPFGGSIPINNDIILDVSYLDFYRLDERSEGLLVGPGVLFATMRKYLRDSGFALKQEITNPNSGTICGWIATGGLGIGAYKYGHVKNSIDALLLLTPDGEWKTVVPDDELFPHIFESEGQIGIVAGAVLDIKRLTYVSKPYAFSFSDAESVQQFVGLIREWNLSPSSVLYFDRFYIEQTYQIQREKLQRDLEDALLEEDDLRIQRVRQEKEVVEKLPTLGHVVVMEFDSKEDYEKALKYSIFNSKDSQSRYRELSYWRLAPAMTHKLWEHRYAPVEMKSKGPAMLVGETILPVKTFSAYMSFIHSSITNLTRNPVKTEGHFLENDEILIQTIILADTEKFRHKLYLALVPLMIEASIHFGGRAYGTGLWNLPFLRGKSRDGHGDSFASLQEYKRQLDPHNIINQSKYVNHSGRNLALRAYKKVMPIFLNLGVKLFRKGISTNGSFSFYSLGRLFWRINKAVFPKIVPPRIEAKRQTLWEINSSCAECDSCERVCPTSDVFGLLGVATPITRRKTANRISRGEKISQEEALGFLVCTRCDNCTRVCPTNIPLTMMFNLVEEDTNFQLALGLNREEKEEFIDRFWEIMKESPLYQHHTKADQKEEGSHLQHGLKIKYPRGFPYAELFIDPETCIKCGMCAHENACTYGARNGNPREIPELLDLNCALCNACINFCPQNKAIQAERDFVQELIENAVDLEEKRYWQNQRHFLRDTTTIQRSPELTEMADIYVTEDILMEIDKESSTGQIPVSGMGQGDRHMGIGFDAERFSHFHIVGPAQNRLHEGDPDEELSVILGKRHRYCKFDEKGNLHNPPFPTLKLMSPIFFNSVRLISNGRVELSFLKVAEKQKSLVFMKANRFLENYDFLVEEGKYETLPKVVVPRIDEEFLHHLNVNPHVSRNLLVDLWNMPMFEIKHHAEMERSIQFIKDSASSISGKMPLLCGYVEVSEYDIIGGIEILDHLRKQIDDFLKIGVDVIHIHGLRNKDNYFVTSSAVRAIHHYLLANGRRHEVSLIASGGIRLASDSQKTIQRGAEATLIDFAGLLALDPYAYKATFEDKTTTDRLMNIDIDWATKRLNNLMESRKVQILEVLGAAGFKDMKKTVGEEGRLIDFYELEERIQKNILENDTKLRQYTQLNISLIEKENYATEGHPNFSDLKKRVISLRSPHSFYELGEINQTVYQRDHVWPGDLIETVGRMASGDLDLLYLKNVKATGLLGDGFDVMKILYQRDPDIIPESELQDIRTAVNLDKNLVLHAPWMFGGKSVGSIGLDTWRAHVIASRELGIQYDTGEGGYPTSFFLNRKGEPIFFTEPEVQLIKPYFEHDTHYTVREIKNILQTNKIGEKKHPHIFDTLKQYPELQPFLFYTVVDEKDEPYVTTELKTGLFGVTKETIKKARRIVIAYSQGAKMGIGGHILAQKVNKLVSYLRGIQGLEYLNNEKIKSLIQRIERIEKNASHPLNDVSKSAYQELLKAHDTQEIFPDLKVWLWKIQQKAYELNEERHIDPIEFEQILRLCEEVIGYSYTSVISPFPFHNCYSIEDVKAFIDMVRMINPRAVVSVKVSPSVDIEFIGAGLGRIAKDNTEEIIKKKAAEIQEDTLVLGETLSVYARKYGMTIELWLDGPRGGTGASPNIIKGQMGMHIEYAIPLIHDRLVQDGLRNYVKFFVSGGIRTYEDVIKAVALGADGVIWGTAPLVAIGCDRNRNCHDGCSRGIATTNLIMQKLRDVDINSHQMINVFLIMQMQLIRALAGLGLKDIRELRGRNDKILWIGLKERVDFRIRQRKEHMPWKKAATEPVHPTGQSNCGVAAVIGNQHIPSYILDEVLKSMKNRGMDGVGVGKTLCFPDHPDHYAYRLMVKGKLQLKMEEEVRQRDGKFNNEREFRHQARQELLEYRYNLAEKLCKVFLEPFFEFIGETDVRAIRESYKTDTDGKEHDYRNFGNPNTDPGDIFRFFVRVKPDVLNEFIEKELLLLPRFEYIREYYPEVTSSNYGNHQKFIQKAEDLYVFNHSLMLTQILYVWDPQPEEWIDHVKQNQAFKEYSKILSGENPLSNGHLETFGESYLYLLKSFTREYPYTNNKERYTSRIRKIAAVMSCGKNFAVWKTAGREIPWDTPTSPNNIIHVRLATGSVVEQMNAHPFAKIHTALTHNGETTNYEALKQRVEQFGLPPLATTDTEVASLKFHLVAEELEYPDWALFESFSPTTGDDLALMPQELRHHLEEVQRVEFASSPDGPYQYLCLRHNPTNHVTERVDLKDPADLRPSTTAFWVDTNSKQKRAFSIIASEEQAAQRLLELLDKEGLVDGAAPDRVMVSNGMISRYHFDENGNSDTLELFDRYGGKIELPEFGEHYSYSRTKMKEPKNSSELDKQLKDISGAESVIEWIRSNLSGWDFDTYRWVLKQVAHMKQEPSAAIKILTHFMDYLRTMDTGKKAKGSLLDITRKTLFEFFDEIGRGRLENWIHITYEKRDIPKLDNPMLQTILIDATGFAAEGIDPNFSLGALLARAYEQGWRRFVLYRVNGQRLISTGVMGDIDTDDVEMDVYGTPGEYFGAFMQGGIIRLHANAQNFTAMCMHHGTLQIFGNAGKVCGYASKGGNIFILGDIVDRAWTNSVNDPRCQDLQIHILGSASKYCGESLMGGDFFFGGLYFDSTGQLRIQDRPYRGTKLMGGASRGNMLFFDPYDHLDPHQYAHGKLKEISETDWSYWEEFVAETLIMSGIQLKKENGKEVFVADGKPFELEPKNFKLMVPKGGLKGYESH